MIGKEYFMRQAAILFGLAKATTDPRISAALLDKAADLKLQVDKLGASPDVTPLAPDIEAAKVETKTDTARRLRLGARP